MNDLHAQIMNIQCQKVPAFAFAGGDVGPEQLRAYKAGHRDARHAAAELALKAVAQPVQQTATPKLNVCATCAGTGEDFNEGDACHVCGGHVYLTNVQPVQPVAPHGWVLVPNEPATPTPDYEECARQATVSTGLPTHYPSAWLSIFIREINRWCQHAAQPVQPAQQETKFGIVDDFWYTDNPHCKAGGAACVDCLMRGMCLAVLPDAAMKPAQGETS